MPPTARFTEGSIPRHVVAMACASALSLLSVFLADILTLVYVSRLHDPLLLASVGLGKSLVFLNGAVVAGVVIAAAAVVAARIGRHGEEPLGRLAAHLLVLAVAVAALVAALEYACLGPLARWLGADPAAWGEGRWFIGLSLAATLPTAALQMCAQLLRAQGQGRWALLALVASAVALAVADPVFIFALGGGVVGAGLAYVLAPCVGAALGLLGVYRHLGLRWPSRPRLFALHARQVAALALPATLGNLPMPLAITYLMVTLAGFGPSALAGMAVIDRVLQLGYCAFFALPAALVPILAQNLGAGRAGRAGQAVAFTARLVLLYGGAVWLVLLFAGPGIADYFALAGAGRSMFLAFCQLGAGLWLFAGLDFIAQSVFLTVGQPWWVPAFGWLRGTLGSLPFIYLGAQAYAATGAVVGLWLGNALVALLAIATALAAARRYRRQRFQ